MKSKNMVRTAPLTRFLTIAWVGLHLCTGHNTSVAQSTLSPQQKDFRIHHELFQSTPSKRPAYLKTIAQLTEKTLVILVSFHNTNLDTFTKTTQQDWENIFFGNRPSVRDYFSTLSFGNLALEKAEENDSTVNNGVVGWNVLANSLSWYKQTHKDSFYVILVRDALISADEAVDYAPFDDNGDGDGYISSHELHIYVIAAAYQGSYFGPPEPNVPRVHVALKAPWRNVVLQLDGKFIGDYEHGGGISLSGELLVGSNTQSKVGLLAHEMGHSLGLPDHYNYPDDGDVWCLMAAGDVAVGDPNYPNHICAPHKEQLGWVTPAIIQADISRQINQIETAGECLKLWENGNPTDEYFLVENRTAQGPNDYVILK